MENDVKSKQLYNIEAEQAILGKIISNNEYFDSIEEILNDENYFYDVSNREIFKYIRNTINMGIRADSITLQNFFDSNSSIVAVGGSAYLSTLLNSAIGLIDVVSYAKIIKDLAVKRNMVLISESIINGVYKDSQKSSSEQLENAEKQLFDLSDKVVGNRGFSQISQNFKNIVSSIEKAKQEGQSITGVPSGIAVLDFILNGFRPSDLIVVGARPGMGKTAFAINLGVNIAKTFLEEFENNSSGDKKTKPKSVGFFSLEMSADQITSRIISLLTSIKSTDFQNLDKMNEENLKKIAEVSDTIAKLPFFIDDTASLSINAIRSRTRKLVERENLSFLIVDYLQLARGSSNSSRESDVKKVTEISQGLKAIAKEFNIPVMALSQLSRSAVQRTTEDKETTRMPELSDLRDSGSIEQDADIVIFLHRDSYYLHKPRSNASEEKIKEFQEMMSKIQNVMTLGIKKNRHGAIGERDIFCDLSINKFDDLADDSYELGR